MSEEGLAAPEGEEKPAEGIAAPSIIDAEGKFTENWRESLQEEIRNEPSLQAMTHINSLAKAFVDTKRMVGKDTMTIPTENSTENDWDAAYAALGRPDTAADYNFQRPADFPEELYSTDLANAAQDMFHKMGLSQKQADTLLAWNLEQTLSAVKQQETDAELEQKTLTDGLYSEWGNAFEQKKHLGNVAIEKGSNGNDEFKARLTEKFGNDPDFIRFAANLGSKFTEHGSVETTMIPTPGDIDAQITELMKTVAFLGGPEVPQEEHLAMVNKVFALRNSKTVQRSA